MMISVEKAKELHSELMVLAHTLKTGSYVDGPSIKQAADMVAKRHGFQSGLELQQQIGAVTQGFGKSKAKPAAKPAAKPHSESYKARYRKLVESHDQLPSDSFMNDLWGCGDGTLSSIRSELRREEGYDFASANGAWMVTKRPAPPAPVLGAVATVPPVPAVNGTVMQGALELVADNSGDEIVRELRQLRALMAMLLGEQRVSNAALLRVWNG
jgi:hypothetical protein